MDFKDVQSRLQIARTSLLGCTRGKLHNKISTGNPAAKDTPFSALKLPPQWDWGTQFYDQFDLAGEVLGREYQYDLLPSTPAHTHAVRIDWNYLVLS